MNNPIIVCAANRSVKNGQIVAGARHWDSVMRGQILRKRFFLFGKLIRPRNWFDAEQGFIDQFGNFYDRKSAWIIADKNGQIKHQIPSLAGTLFSEDLY